MLQHVATSQTRAGRTEQPRQPTTARAPLSASPWMFAKSLAQNQALVPPNCLPHRAHPYPNPHPYPHPPHQLHGTSWCPIVGQVALEVQYLVFILVFTGLIYNFHGDYKPTNSTNWGAPHLASWHLAPSGWLSLIGKSRCDCTQSE